MQYTPTPHEIHDAKLTLKWLEKNTPQQWAVGLRTVGDAHCAIGHIQIMLGQDPYGSDYMTNGLCSIIGINHYKSNIARINNDLGGDKQKILARYREILKEACEHAVMNVAP